MERRLAGLEEEEEEAARRRQPWKMPAAAVATSTNPKRAQSTGEKPGRDDGESGGGRVHPGEDGGGGGGGGGGLGGKSPAFCGGGDFCCPPPSNGDDANCDAVDAESLSTANSPKTGNNVRGIIMTSKRLSSDVQNYYVLHMTSGGDAHFFFSFLPSVKCQKCLPLAASFFFVFFFSSTLVGVQTVNFRSFLTIERKVDIDDEEGIKSHPFKLLL